MTPDNFDYLRQKINPQKDFRDTLRAKLINKMENSETYLEKKLEEVAQKITPNSSFRISLREKLTSKVIRTRSIFSSFTPRFLQQSSKFVRASLGVATSVATVFAVVFTSIFFGTSFSTQAASKTQVVDFVGEVTLLHGGNSEMLETRGRALAENTIVETGENSSATIRFFEDSVLRLDAKSSVMLENLSPHPTQDDLGEVSVKILSGRAWVRTFSVDEKFSEFNISLRNTNIVLDSGSSIDVLIGERTGQVRVWEKSSRVIIENEEILLLSGKRGFQNAMGEFVIDQLSANEYLEKWTRRNINKDENLINEFIAEKIAQKEILAEEEVSEIREDFLFSPEEGAKGVTAVENLFFEALEELIATENPGTDFAIFENAARKVHEADPEGIHAFLASAEKTIDHVLPDSPLFIAKEKIEILQEELAEQERQKIIKEKQRTKRLWEASRLAEKGNIRLAEQIVQETAENSQESKHEVTAEVIEEKQEQLMALNEIEGISEKIVEETEEMVIRETTKIIHPGFLPKQTEEGIKKEITKGIGKYTSKIGQKNALNSKLKKIESSANNLALLVQIREELPDGLKKDVNEKIMETLEYERKKVVEKREN